MPQLGRGLDLFIKNPTQAIILANPVLPSFVPSHTLDDALLPMLPKLPSGSASRQAAVMVLSSASWRARGPGWPWSRDLGVGGRGATEVGVQGVQNFHRI